VILSRPLASITTKSNFCINKKHVSKFLNHISALFFNQKQVKEKARIPTEIIQRL
jgi:hypothetical protein